MTLSLNRSIDTIPRLSEASIGEQYSPLPFGPIASQSQLEAIVMPILTGRAKQLWTETEFLQDKRGDFGHAAVVPYLTNALCTLCHVDDAERETAQVAAILHDTGWAKIPNIKDAFAEAQNLKASSLQSKIEEGKRLDKALRYLHQQYAVDVAHEALGNYKHIDDVIEVINAHDTRETPVNPSVVCACMWDADVLWRVTVPGILADWHRLSPDTIATEGYTPEGLCERNGKKWLQLERHALLLPISLTVGRIELARARAYFSTSLK